MPAHTPTAPPADRADEVLPITAAIRQQTRDDPPLPLRTGGFTRPGMYYVVARLEEGGSVIAWSGPFLNLNQVEEALKTTPVRGRHAAAVELPQEGR